MIINIILFEDFETLDVFGPVEILGHAMEVELNFLSLEGGLIKSRQGTEIVTKAIDISTYSGVFFLPGGQGTRSLVDNAEFIDLIKEMADRSQYCLTVCTGSALLAKTGRLNGKRATSNKRAFDWVVSVNAEVDWVGRARWVVDGKYYTSSGVSAGMDMSLGFVKDIFGGEAAREIADRIEYSWHEDKEEDPFAR
ncbi:MAG: ThiJ/PfpI protein [Anaerocolumna sp.]|jgi:putative intracellular protease/amidase|nr:ThiJ/PfpI protein [Anaerocolumna sp.]